MAFDSTCIHACIRKIKSSFKAPIWRKMRVYTCDLEEDGILETYLVAHPLDGPLSRSCSSLFSGLSERVCVCVCVENDDTWGLLERMPAKGKTPQQK